MLYGKIREDDYWQKFGPLFACLAVVEKEQTIDSIGLQVIGPSISSLTLELRVDEETSFVEDVYNLVESRASLIPDSCNMARLDLVKLQPYRADHDYRRMTWAIHTPLATRLAPLREFGLTLTMPEVNI
jgi:hypothetical protein